MMDHDIADRSAESVIGHVAHLRRHARMLLGEQAAADELVANALETFEVGEQADLKVALFRVLHDALRNGPPMAADIHAAVNPENVADARLRSLSSRHRAVLLLTAVEGLTVDDVAEILSGSPKEIARLADEAQILIERELATSVLIIEDEWMIARDLRRIVGDLGHEVAAVAATKTDAVAAAKRHKPGLVLADVQLADNSSGIEAVGEILADRKTPTIFITAFPERLLTGERPEPTYLISKPYSPAKIQATISQALFFSTRT